jgi:hypothetical protein
MVLPTTIGGRVLRLTALAIHLLLLQLASFVLVSGLLTLSVFPYLVLTPEGLAQAGIVFFPLIVSTTWVQYKRSFSPMLGVQVTTVGLLLFYCMLNHAFPEKSRLFAIPHDILGTFFTGLNVRRIWLDRKEGMTAGD